MAKKTQNSSKALSQLKELLPHYTTTYQKYASLCEEGQNIPPGQISRTLNFHRKKDDVFQEMRSEGEKIKPLIKEIASETGAKYSGDLMEELVKLSVCDAGSMEYEVLHGAANFFLSPETDLSGQDSEWFGGFFG